MTAVKQICTREDVDLSAGGLKFTSRALEAVGIYVHSMTNGPEGISTKPFLGLGGVVQ
ncbi:hypothetical protein ALQ26_200092 [Pseudomonas amygdali pv. lachrymans]|nr:hypothetical protein ALQ26_200092 [Pseudomonas amygdali pv. lachrymans]